MCWCDPPLARRAPPGRAGTERAGQRAEPALREPALGSTVRDRAGAGARGERRGLLGAGALAIVPARRGAGLRIAALFLATAWIREPQSHQKQEEEGFLAIIGQVLRNPHARIILGIVLCEQIALILVLSGLPFFSDYVLQTPGRSGSYMRAAIVPQLSRQTGRTLRSGRFG